jgi:hypothetical protein
MRVVFSFEPGMPAHCRYLRVPAEKLNGKRSLWRRGSQFKVRRMAHAIVANPNAKKLEGNVASQASIHIPANLFVFGHFHQRIYALPDSDSPSSGWTVSLSASVAVDRS